MIPKKQFFLAMMDTFKGQDNDIANELMKISAKLSSSHPI